MSKWDQCSWYSYWKYRITKLQLVNYSFVVFCHGSFCSRWSWRLPSRRRSLFLLSCFFGFWILEIVKFFVCQYASIPVSTGNKFVTINHYYCSTREVSNPCIIYTEAKEKRSGFRTTITVNNSRLLYNLHNIIIDNALNYRYSVRFRSRKICPLTITTVM